MTVLAALAALGLDGHDLNKRRDAVLAACAATVARLLVKFGGR